MQDGAPCHTAKIIKNFLETQNVTLLDWPGNSPDLNPLENLWGILKRKIATDTVTTKQQLIVKVIDVWNRDPDITNTLHARRIAAVIAAKGGSTTY